MGVSVRLSKNVRMYLPFWVAIPVWLLVAAVWVTVGTLYLAGLLLVQGYKLSASGIDAMSKRRAIRQAAPIVRGAPDIATTRAASAAVGRWRGTVRNIRRGRGRVQFEVLDPDCSPPGPFVLRQRWQSIGLSIPRGIGYRDLASLRAGDVVELVAGASGRDPRVSIVQRADGTFPEPAGPVAPAEEPAVPHDDVLLEATTVPAFRPAEIPRPAMPQIRIDGPGRPWQRDWARWVLILALPTIIVGLVIYSTLGPVGKDVGTVLVDLPLLVAVPAALITLLVRWLRKWRGSRTRNAA
jgi:hypothetical protein